jgi:hypothetical protein
MHIAGNDLYGPWAPGLDKTERIARLRSFRTLTLLFAHGETAFIGALAAAESSDTALRLSRVLFDQVSALPRRKILASYNEVVSVTESRGAMVSEI